MLSALHIQNYALIRNLDMAFYAGFNTITGETGAGKSIILGALGLILGNRADSSALLDGARKCIVEAKFDVQLYNIQDFFEASDIDYEPIAILRREIAANGKSRAFVNDTPVNLNTLRQLGEKLIDIHSQRQTSRLLDNNFQLSLLDAFSQHKNTLEEYHNLFKEYRHQLEKLNQLKERQGRAQKEYDYNFFQLTEIDAAGLHNGEMEELEGELNLLSHADNIRQTLEDAIYNLHNDEQSINGRLSILCRNFSPFAAINPRLTEINSRLNGLLIESKDILNDMELLNNSIIVDNERMEELSARHSALNHLLAKHHFQNINELIEYGRSLRKEIASVENLSEDIAALEKTSAALYNQLEKLADEISNNRRKQIKPLEENMVRLLKQLGIPEAIIHIALSDAGKLTESGKDSIRLLFSANRGSSPELLSQIGSGGELSRVMLCFKYILADSIFLPTIIFDEIDAGVSGEIAIAMGQMMKRLSAQHQLITITHLPQIAAIGSRQYRVYKNAEKDFTTTHISELTVEERIIEVAKMIGGNNPSHVAIENAKELLNG